MNTSTTSAAMAILLFAFDVVFIVGLVVIPAIQEAQAANFISSTRDKGARGEQMSDGKRNGQGGSGGGGCATCG